MYRNNKYFIMSVVQPGLLGLIDGTMATLAPLFAAAYATGSNHITFIVGLSAAVGAGISMAFSEGISDTGELTGRGKPWIRGLITGFMTFVGAGLHTIPFLLPFDNHDVLKIASVVVGLELLAIAGIHHYYYRTKLIKSMACVIGAGVLIFLSGIYLGGL